MACAHKLFKVTNSGSPVCHGFKDAVTPVHIPLHKFYTCSSPHADIQMFKTRMFSSPRQKYFQIFWKFLHAWTLFVLSMCFARGFREKIHLQTLSEIYDPIYVFAYYFDTETFRKKSQFSFSAKKTFT